MDYINSQNIISEWSLETIKPKKWLCNEEITQVLFPIQELFPKPFSVGLPVITVISSMFCISVFPCY